MFDVLVDSLTVQRAIFVALVLGDFLLAVLIALLMERREAAENAEITGFPPQEEETGEARRVREAREDADAFRRIQNYSVRDAYGGDSG